MLVRYVVSDAEEAQVSNASAFAAFTQEKATYHDLITVPAVPRGRLRQLLSTSPPDGGGCVLKILSWLQHAARALQLVETAVCPLCGRRPAGLPGASEGPPLLWPHEATASLRARVASGRRKDEEPPLSPPPGAACDAVARVRRRRYLLCTGEGAAGPEPLSLG